MDTNNSQQPKKEPTGLQWVLQFPHSKSWRWCGSGWELMCDCQEVELQNEDRWRSVIEWPQRRVYVDEQPIKPFSSFSWRTSTALAGKIVFNAPTSPALWPTIQLGFRPTALVKPAISTPTTIGIGNEFTYHSWHSALGLGNWQFGNG